MVAASLDAVLFKIIIHTTCKPDINRLCNIIILYFKFILRQILRQRDRKLRVHRLITDHDLIRIHIIRDNIRTTDAFLLLRCKHLTRMQIREKVERNTYHHCQHTAQERDPFQYPFIHH